MSNPSKRSGGRLGKGLSSLMATPGPSLRTVTDSVSPVRGGAGADPVAAEPAEVPRGTSAPPVTLVPLEQLHPNPHQPRKTFDGEALEGLAQSIRSEGLIQPITARARPAGGLEIVAGERRWRAAGLAGLAAVPVLIRVLDDAVAARWALIENVQREDLNPIERAEALQQLVDGNSLKHADVGDAVGLSRPMVSNLLRLLTLGPPVRKLVAEGHLRMGHARALLAVDEPRRQEELAHRCVTDQWSVRALEQAIRAGASRANVKTPKTAAPTEVRAGWLRDLESQLSAGLETPVHVSPGRRRGTGTVTLEYRSLEDFDRLVERLGVRTG